MKYLIVKQLSIDNHFLWDIWFQALLSVYQQQQNNSHRFLAKIVASHHFPKYFHIIKKNKWSLNIGFLSICTLEFFLDRFVMVVRKNVLEYVISLAVAKNKVRLKKCLKQFKYDKVLLLLLRLIPKFRPVFDDQF